MAVIEWRTPRSEIETKFQRIQKLSDEIGVVIFNEITWMHEDSPSLTAKKIAFERFLDDAQKLASEYIGEPKAIVSLEARYLYDTKDEREKDINDIAWRPVLPGTSLHFAASISGEVDQTFPIKAMNPETKTFGWRICTIINAFQVMGYQGKSADERRLKVAVPLSEILTMPVKFHNHEEFYLDPEKLKKDE